VRIEQRTVGLFEENCYLLIDEQARRGVLIDPGDEGGRILDMVRDAGVAVDAIWLTHAHVDHIGAIAEVRRAIEAPVLLHALDLPYYTSLSARAAELYGLDFEQPDGPHGTLTEGQELRCGALRFSVMHVPGHAPGLVAFTGHGISFGGDLLFAGSIGRTDLPLGDPSEMERSLARYATLPPETIVYPGHGPRTTLARELQTNPFLTGAARLVRR
jgi:glyoxylase-like metal-dependent hydrolase (beta-lactamase superfamily II)